MKKAALILLLMAVMTSNLHSFEMPLIGSKSATKNNDLDITSKALEEAIYSQGYNDGWKSKADSDQWTTWIREVGYIVIIYKLASQ